MDAIGRGATRALLALALLAGAPRIVGAAPAAAPEDGAIAPAGCWSTEGGCPARTRAGAKRIEVLRLREDGFGVITSIDAADDVGDLLLFRREIYATVGGTLTRYDVGSHAPAWTSGGNCRGRLALRGDLVYGVEYDNRSAYLEAWSRRTGQPEGVRALMGYH